MVDFDKKSEISGTLRSHIVRILWCGDFPNLKRLFSIRNSRLKSILNLQYSIDYKMYKPFWKFVKRIHLKKMNYYKSILKISNKSAANFFFFPLSFFLFKEQKMNSLRKKFKFFLSEYEK